MRYLFVSSARDWSGTTRAFVDAARGLSLRGHAVTVSVEPDSAAEQHVSAAAIEQGRSLFAVEPLSFEGTWIAAAMRLRSTIRRLAADVVFVHGDREHLIAVVAIRLGARASLVRRIPAGRTLVLRRSGRVAAFLARTFYLFASEPDMHASRLPRRTAGSGTAPLGVEVSDLVDDRVDGETIVCVHDASSRSRAATAIRTVAMLAARHERVELSIMGEGHYDDDLRMQAAALGVLSRVAFLGDRGDALRVMSGATLGWVVASGDTAAFAVLDFMALGVPVLGGAGSEAERYVLHEITGMLLPPDDAFVTAAVVAELLTSAARRETIGMAARVRVAREFPLSAMIDAFERAAAAATTGRDARRGGARAR